MAYFSNGTEGMAYEEHYCVNCMHGENPEKTCPVLHLHMLWNYDACNSGAKDATAQAKFVALDTLIPRSEDHLENEQCTMFMPNEDGKRAENDAQKLIEWEAVYGKRTDEDELPHRLVTA